MFGHRIVLALIGTLSCLPQAWGDSSNSASLYRPATSGWAIQFAQNGLAGAASLDPQVNDRPLVWGAGRHAPGTGFYVPCCRDPLSTTGPATARIPHDRAWFIRNHPDWLVYSAPTATTPSTGGGAGNLWAVDIANPTVQQYMLAYALGQCPAADVYPTCRTDLPADLLARRRGGHAYVSLDNLAAYNAAEIRGHFVGAVPGCPAGEPACGGTWVQRYTGSQLDQAYADDIFRYTRFLKAGLNAKGVGLWTNNKVNKRDVRNSATLASIGDASLSESAFLHACRAGVTTFVSGMDEGSDWYSRLQVSNAVYGKQVVVQFNYLCGHPVSEASAAEIAYATANYYLTRDEHTYFEMQNGSSVGRQDVGRRITYPSSMMVNLGRPTEPPPAAGKPNSSGGCYQRSFERGMVVVWPSDAGSCTYTVPPGGQWADQFGNPVHDGVNTLQSDTSTSVARANAIVIVKSD
ncbi:hypothetical protein [Labrys wisconsinensis]|uniref:Uncharacterized protein n=1 Tax=Labrys wisconsinensis TaxID=425677 RepID=A0ABU0J6Q6_9HYPH|nr:hypothetical protein [Labrys wisconsinensis]MDQ0469945.1 hypothetical protein [Labrys wisconsinensis]